MFNSLREELNKIALMEDDELDMMDTHEVGGDDGAADDELVDDENFFEEEDDDDIMDDIENGRETPSANEIDNIMNKEKKYKKIVGALWCGKRKRTSGLTCSRRTPKVCLFVNFLKYKILCYKSVNYRLIMTAQSTMLFLKLMLF